MAQDNNRPSSGAYTREYYDQYNNTITNGEARIPICFCVDTSSSMQFFTKDSEVVRDENSRHIEDGKVVYYAKPKPGGRVSTLIQELQTVFRKMLMKMQQNDVISKAAVICIVQFDQFADCYVEFTDINRLSPQCINNITTRADQTNISKGLHMSLDRLDQQMDMLSNAGNDIYKPVLIVMSDGSPTDGDDASRARELVRRRAEEGSLNVIPIGIGAGYDEQWLKALSSESRVYSMSCEAEFNQVFDGITKRIQRTAMVIAADEDTDEMSKHTDQGTETTEYGHKADTNDLLALLSLGSSSESYDVFISKNSEDTGIAIEMYNFLESHGLKCFESETCLTRKGDSDYFKQIEDALDNSHHMVVVCSKPEYLESEWVRHEWQSFFSDKLSSSSKGNLITVFADSIKRDQLPHTLRNLEIFKMSEYKDKILPFLPKK